MSFVEIFKDRNAFESFKAVLPGHWALDIPDSNYYKLFKAIGQEFLILYVVSRDVATSRWLGTPTISPNVEPDEITGTPHINLLQIGGITLERLGELLRLSPYTIIQEREQSYRERLIGTVQEVFGGGTKPSIIRALEMATKRFDGYGDNQDGYTPIIIEPFTPIPLFGTESTAPTGGFYFYFGDENNPPSLSQDGDWAFFQTESSISYDPSILHFIVQFNLDPFVGNGHYYGKDSFRNDPINENPVNWAVDLEPANTHAWVVEEIDGHKQVLEMYDASGSGLVKVRYVYPEGSATYGTIEYWYRSNKISAISTFSVTENLFNTLINVQLDNNYFRYWDGIASWLPIAPAIQDFWHHIKITFECTAGNFDGLNQFEWNFYLDGIKYGAFPFFENRTFTDMCWFQTTFGESPQTVWVDAFDYDWAIEYFANRSKWAEASDYEYWGGRYIFGDPFKSPFDLDNFNADYVKNYQFLYGIIQQLKLAGVSFEIQMEAV
jgi:hypothetical protein